MTSVFIITWKYSDGSGCGAVRAYRKQDLAESDLNILRMHSGTKTFELEKVDLID